MTLFGEIEKNGHGLFPQKISHFTSLLHDSWVDTLLGYYIRVRTCRSLLPRPG